MAISLEQLKEWGVPLVAPIGSVFANSDNNHTSKVRGSSLPSQDEIDESRHALNEEITKLNNYLERLTIVLGQPQTADTQAEHIRLLNNISAVNLPPEIKMVVAARYPQHVSNEVQKVTDKNKSNVDNPSSLAQQVAIMDVAARISSYNHTQYMLEVQSAFAEMDAARKAIHDDFMNSQGTQEDCQRFHKQAQQERKQKEKEHQATLANWDNLSEEEKMWRVMLNQQAIRSLEQEAEELKQQIARETDPTKKRMYEHRLQEVKKSSAQKKRFDKEFQEATKEMDKTRGGNEAILEYTFQEFEQSTETKPRDTSVIDYLSKGRRKSAQTQTNVEAKASGNQRQTEEQKSGHGGSPLTGATPFEKGSSTDSDRQILEQRMANFRTLYEQASTPEQKKEYAVKLHRTQKEFTALSGQNHKNGTQNLTETPSSTLTGLAINAASMPSIQGDSNANTPATLAQDQSTPTGSLVDMDSLASAKPFSGEKQKPSEAQPNSPSNSSLIGKLALASAEQPSVPREFDITRLQLDNAPSIA